MGQAEHLACRKRQSAYLRALPAPTPGGATSNHRKAPVATVSALCAGLMAGVKVIPGKFRRHQTAYGAEAVPDRGIKQGFPCVRPRDILNLPNHSDSPWAIEAADTRRRISCGYHNGHALEHPEPEIPRTGDSDIGSVFSTPARRLSRLADVGEIDFCTPEKSTPEKGVKGDCSGGAGCEGTAPVVNRFT